MRPRPALVCHLLCLGSLRCASLLVPAEQRGEWWREWRSELWHVRQACTPERGICWSAEREVAAFCLGAFQDGLCLRGHSGPRRIPRATMMGSAMQCLILLAGLAGVGFGIGLLLPGVSAIVHSPRYRDAQNLMLIRDAHYTEDSVPTISAAQYKVWTRRRQELFDGFAYYQVVQKPMQAAMTARTSRAIAIASPHLFDLLGLPVRFAPGESSDGMPRLIMSDEMWRRDFGGDPEIFGRRIRVGSIDAVLEGVTPRDSWRLPGKVDAWLLEPNAEGIPDGMGFVVGHLKPSTAHDGWGESWHMSAPRPDGAADDFFCVSLKERTRGPWDIFFFAVFLGCLALPATTSLPLGEYKLSSRRLSWSMRLRRWSFLGCKIVLLMPIVYFVALDLAHLRQTIDPISCDYIQLVSSFSVCLFGLRWTLRDQRQRCPVCLRKLTHPARVGQPSRNFLDWNGMELICAGGHGLLHVPEIQTSWFSEQRWLYLDPSWKVLFPDPGLASTGYF
jgi:hypothetical protein